ncbi:MAG: 2-hydroxyacyl-CoA dehydratase [Gammaproteobacteria bacterium]|nr:2-hydroxyacyl-CoA dehydratase [Gammaproteobacteria bacterium]
MNGNASRTEVDARLRDPLADCRARPGGVGVVGPDIPIDVLIASGRPFGHLPWRSEGATPWADRWLESSFPYWSRSILEQWHDGAFDALETVVFSRADDASQRLYYYVGELQRRGRLGGPVPRMFDIALIQRESSLAHTEAAVLDLMRALDVAADKLPEGIERANRLRRGLAELERSRAGDGPSYERLGRAALWTDPCTWIERVQRPQSSPAAVRIMLAGSMPPDERLHEAVEAAGASIVAEAHALGLGRLGPELGAVQVRRPGEDRAVPSRASGDGAVSPDAPADEPEPPARALARHLRAASLAPRAFIDRAAGLVDRARAAKASAVVIWLTREDEALAWSAPSQQRALAAEGLPVLLLAARRWQADDDTPERIMEFVGRCANASA